MNKCVDVEHGKNSLDYRPLMNVVNQCKAISPLSSMSSNVPKIKLFILDEIHKTRYLGHPSYQKTITMLRKDYLWPNMKTSLAEYIAI